MCYRPHVSLGDNQRAAVEAFEAYHNSEQGAAGAAAAKAATTVAVAAGGAEQRVSTAPSKGWAVADESEKEPTAIAMKQKPAMRTWPSRFIRIKDKSLLVFEDQADYNKWEKQHGGGTFGRGATCSDRACDVDYRPDGLQDRQGEGKFHFWG